MGRREGEGDLALNKTLPLTSLAQSPKVGGDACWLPQASLIDTVSPGTAELDPRGSHPEGVAVGCPSGR